MTKRTSNAVRTHTVSSLMAIIRSDKTSYRMICGIRGFVGAEETTLNLERNSCRHAIYLLQGPMYLYQPSRTVSSHRRQ